MKLDIKNKKADIQKKIKEHSKNSIYIKWIYYTLSLVGLIFNTISSLLIGSKSIKDLSDSISLIVFILTLTSTLIITVVNFLKLESKSSHHNQSKTEYEELMYLIDDDNLLNNKEKYDAVYNREIIIGRYAPDTCF